MNRFITILCSYFNSGIQNLPNSELKGKSTKQCCFIVGKKYQIFREEGLSQGVKQDNYLASLVASNFIYSRDQRRGIFRWPIEKGVNWRSISEWLFYREDKVAGSSSQLTLSLSFRRAEEDLQVSRRRCLSREILSANLSAQRQTALDLQIRSDSGFVVDYSSFLGEKSLSQASRIEDAR